MNRADPRGTVRIRTRQLPGFVEVRVIIRHPMEFGNVPDAVTGRVRPAHYIAAVWCESDGRLLWRADWSRAVSRNPFLSFRTTLLQPGDRLGVHWQDNLGMSDTGETTVGRAGA